MTPADLPHLVGVVGAGTMGSGIGLVFALAGCQARLTARRASSLEQSDRRIDASLELLVRAGKITRRQAAPARERITLTTSLADALTGCDLVIETITEEITAKLDVLGQAERLIDSEAILTTDTSSFSIDELAGALEHPGRFAGFHWFNPPELVELVEIVSGSRTEPSVASRLVAWAERIGKSAVHVRVDTPGFIGNRLQYALLREAFALVAAGVCSYADVDRAVKTGLGARWAAVGPFETVDLAGLDVHREVARGLFPALSTAQEPAPVVEELVAAGALGCKSGHGLYGDYDEAAVRRLLERRAAVLLALASLRGEDPS